ncbi:hypothetical protein [Bradyrhizobium cenepequi]
MGLEIAYGIGALVLLTVLIYGTLQYHFRNRQAMRSGEEAVRRRYEHNET